MLKQLQSAISYQFTQVHLLELALTHSSAANELNDSQNHNERLEFLGDAVLELCISKELYIRFSSAREGQLTTMRSKLVNQTVLASIARVLNLGSCLILGKGEESQGGRTRDSLLSDGVEALIGAVFVDGGYFVAEKVVLGLYKNLWPKPEENKKSKDAKSTLQEVTQQMFKERPIYTLLDSEGPEHAKCFSVRLTLPNQTVIDATGTSVKRAEQAAAQAALSMLQNNQV